MRCLTARLAVAILAAAALPLAGATSAAAQLGTISTVAGDGTQNQGPPSARYKIGQARGVAVDRAGNRYFVENSRVMKVDEAGVLSTVSDRGGLGIAADRFGNVYTCDASQAIKISPNGTRTVLAGTFGSTGFSGDGGPAVNALLNRCWGIAVDDAGNVYLADTFNSRIRKIDTAGIIRTVAGGGNPPDGVGDGGPATSASVVAYGVAVDRVGNIFIADSNRVRMVNTFGFINTVAGQRNTGFAGDGGPATSAMLGAALSVSVDDAGNIYIADGRNQRIRRVDRATYHINTVAGDGVAGYAGDGGPAVNARIGYDVYGVAVDPGGRRIYIGDMNNYRLRQVDNSTGIITTLAGTGSYGQESGDRAISSPLHSPSGLAFDRAGNMYVAERTAGLVRRVDTAGRISMVAGNGELTYPRHVAVDGAGNVYVSDGVHRVRKVSPAGVITTVAGTGTAGFSGDGGPATAAMLSTPEGVAVDGAGNLYISDGGNHRVRKVNGAGVISTVAGNGHDVRCGDGGPATNACIGSPAGLAVDAAGTLYLTDTSNQVVRKVSPAGIISTLAGNGTAGFSGDFGPATAAQMYFPWSVAADRSGNVYIADTGNQRIRLVEPSGRIRTVAGNGAAGYSGDNGPAIDAALNGPRDIAVDAAGDLFIADDLNHRVRKVIAPPPLPAAPVANEDVFEIIGTYVTGNVLTNDSGDRLTVFGYSRASQGAVGVGPNGDFTYKPASTEVTDDQFAYTVRDSSGQTATATVYLSRP